MAVVVEFLVVAFTFIVFWFVNDFFKQKRRPPGPKHLPVIGTLHTMIAARKNKKPPYEFLMDLSKIYGPIMSLKMGVVDQIVTSDFETIKEILNSDVWIDRYMDKWMMERSFNKSLGIIFISGAVHKEMRRFTTRTLRDFGFGRNKSMDSVIELELVDTKARLNSILEKNGNIVGLKQFFTVSVLNIMWSMVAQERFAHDDQKLGELIQLIDEMSKANPIAGNLLMAFPFLRRFLPKSEMRTRFLKRMHSFFRDLLEERRSLGLYKEEQRDFVDVFLQEIDSHKDEDEDTNFYTDEQFIIVTFDLFVAGSETTSNTLEFAFLYMCLHPEVQAKVQKEIDTVVGSSRPPSTADRPQMPYTEATLLEVQRLSNVLPLIIRCPKEDTKVGPYDIAKGTMGVLNTYAWHLNESQWKNPTKFDPERFLDDKGQVINAHKILPFGLGKRACLGEVLAKATLFQYFTSLLQSFTFKTSPNHDRPTDKPHIGFTLSPHPYYAQITPR